MPATLLDARGVIRHHGTRAVLDRVDLRVDARSRIGLIGPNGAGKSTLLRILAGEERPDRGDVRRHGTVAHVPQLAGAGGDLPVRAVLLERLGVGPAARELDRLTAVLEAGDVSAVVAHAAALDRWLAVGGPDADARLDAAAADLGLAGALLDRPARTLSGGQAARAGLAALRTARTDVLLLDEPGNHLDAGGLRWLRALLAERAGGLVLVTHDRALLRDVATELVELDVRTGTATRFGGGWDAYVADREAGRRRALADHGHALAQRDAIAAAEREIRRRAAASAARVRDGGHDGDKHVKEHVTARAQGMQARARRVATRAARVEIPDKPFEAPPLRLALTAAERRSAWAVTLEAAVLRRAAWSMGPVDLAVAHGDRIALTGANGSGKSTLLAALAGHLSPAEGVRRAARGAVVAELGQGRDLVVGGAAAASAPDLEALVRAQTGLGRGEARAALAAFGLGAEVVSRPVTTLSPGERTRAQLAVLGQRRATVLLLDEPTNHLDVDALQTIEAALRDWPGALVVATHDPVLRDGLRLDRELRL